ncbi:unnamed protein product [Nezara viridula]|uniref:Neuropeptide n=1 Tax=Nezara viridula TaxID=85310 RepID=A0A9P0HKQ6_NEZVI|nr:unnamed protein product [Nezara viridula]
MNSCALLTFAILLIARPISALEYSEGTYRGITIAIDPQVPRDNCQAVLNNLETDKRNRDDTVPITGRAARRPPIRSSDRRFSGRSSLPRATTIHWRQFVS